MGHPSVRHPLSLKPIVCRFRSTAASIDVVRDIEYGTGPDGPLTIDIYRRRGAEAARLQPVFLVTGYADIGVPRPLGCAFKEMRSVTSTAELLAASGFAAVAYTASQPTRDGIAVLDYLRTNGAAHGIDAGRFALWATSGHVPLALSLLIDRRASIDAAVLLNGFMFDVDGLVETATRTFHFANPIVDRTIDDLDPSVALFVVRSGRDEFAGVNETIDRFVADAIRRNLPIMFVNHATAPHAFDINDDSDASRLIIHQAIAFLRLRLMRGTEGTEVTDLHGATE